jgi:hypothetical protein
MCLKRVHEKKKEIVVTKVPLCVCVKVAKVPRIPVSYRGCDDYLASIHTCTLFFSGVHDKNAVTCMCT